MQVSCLRSAPIDELVSSFESLAILNTGFGHFPGLSASSIFTIDLGPSIDGELIEVQPSEAGVRVPSVIGYSKLSQTLLTGRKTTDIPLASNDGALFVATSPAFSNPLAISEQNYTAFLTQSFGSAGASIIEQQIPLSAFNTTGAPGFAAIDYVFTASEYQCPAYRALNKALENGVDAWAYVFDHAPSCPWIPGLSQAEAKLLGATHTSELPFVFGNIDDLPLPNGTCDLNPTEKSLSEFMIDAWTEMAASQRPASQAIWPQYTAGNVSEGLTFKDNPLAGIIDFEICELFDQIRDAEIEAAGKGGCAGDTAA